MRKRTMFRRTALLMLISYGISMGSWPSFAGGPSIPGLKGPGTNIPAPAPNATPVPRGSELPVPAGVFPGVASIEKPTDGSLVIHQNQPKAIIDWDSFDIGKNASTHFDQQGNSHWTALNRIYDRNPSRIFGKLTADGKVYLINQNGILFGPDSKVNVHTLVASALNLRDEDFLANRLRLRAENYQAPGQPLEPGAAVVNQGAITTSKAGAAFLVAPEVENSGFISAPVGQIGLAAGTEVEIEPDKTFNSTRSALVVNVKNGAGEVLNKESGQLIADNGLVGMYGATVNQEGLVRAVTSAKKQGRVEIFASERISTGPKSITETPITDSKERVHQSFEFQGGEILFQGLDPSNPLFPRTPVSRIEHRGVLRAPSGTVLLRAQDRVFLDDGSLIDVAGLWVDRPLEAQFLSVQLNSVELRDDHAQKTGILRGQTIQVSGLLGSSIGDISGALTSQELTAAEQAVRGGTINIGADEGDIIVKQGALLDFSGGGFRYEGGYVNTTYLLSGRRVYDISSAPEWLLYESIVNKQIKVHERFGVAETYEGLYFGGAAPVLSFAAGHVEGHDGGTLHLSARVLVLDGKIDGSVVRGPYQTLPSEPVDSLGLQLARGRKEPKGGTLVIGNRPLALASPETQDFATEAIAIRKSAEPLPQVFGPEDPLPAKQGAMGSQGVPLTTISSELINTAGLGRLEVYANTTVRIEPEANINLNSSGSLIVGARRIEHFGAITIPSGNISLLVRDNMTSYETILNEYNPRYIPLQSRLFIAGGSLLDVSGERANNTPAGRNLMGGLTAPHTTGGSIELSVGTFAGDAAILAKGSQLDVSGGWEMGPDGKIRGATAGVLSVVAPSLVLEGDIKGYALAGQTGGQLILHASNLWVKGDAPTLPSNFDPNDELPEPFRNSFILAQDRLDATGFSRITLLSSNDLRIDQGMTLSPSWIRITEPAMTGDHGIPCPGFRGSGFGMEALRKVSLEEAGGTSIIARAGVALGGGPSTNLNATVLVGEEAHLFVAPGGEIQLQGPWVDLGGHLEAPGGRITLNATLKDAILREGGGISAQGYLKPSTSSIGGMEGQLTPVAGGNVAIRAPEGNITMESGFFVDVSGSPPTQWTILNQDGTFSKKTTASDPGSVEFTFLGSFNLEGTVVAKAAMEGLRGGSLTILKTSVIDPLVIDVEKVHRYQEMGFDALTLGSYRGLEFMGSMDVRFGRSLTLDAPEIWARGSSEISLSAPWLKLVNSYYPSSTPLSLGDARLHLQGDFLDLEGSLRLSSFSHVFLEAREDMRFSDRFYRLSGLRDVWSGLLETNGDLTLAASRIFPTTLSNVTVRSGGQLTILPGPRAPSPLIFSAGGSISLEAPRIDHRGYVAAPLGSINLTGTGSNSRVHLAPGSVLSTAGQASVNYGILDDWFWAVEDRGTLLLKEVVAPPQKSVSLQAMDLILREKATVDASGGGAIFAYQFLPGVEGSVNPLQIKGRYVIVPDGSVRLPGEAVYLNGIAGLPSGVYSLLPPEYAFMPGAIIIQDLGPVSPATPIWSKEGYPITTGYFTVMNTGIESHSLRSFSVRPARDVLREGHFALRRVEAGEGGMISARADTTILNGSIRATGLEGYRGGTLALSGREVIVGSSLAMLPADFDLMSPIPQELRGKLFLDASKISGSSLAELILGDLMVTETVTLLAGTTLEAPKVVLAANRAITLEEEAALRAKGDGGMATLLVPRGSLLLGSGSVVEASQALILDARTMDLHGDLIAQGELNLLSDKIFFMSESGVRGTSEGLYIPEELWRSFSGIDRVALTARQELNFLGFVDLEARESLIINTPRIAADTSNGSPRVSLSAPTVSLLNTGVASTNTSFHDSGLLTVRAQEMFIGRGHLLFDGFSRLDLIATDDLTFLGVGSLTSSGDLTLGGARVTTSYYADHLVPYQVANFRVDAGDNRMAITPGTGRPGTSSTPGGRLEFTASSIDVSGTIEVNSGQVILNATGPRSTDSVLVRAGGRILARGTEFTPGGTLTLSARNGVVAIQGGALLDVSAGPQGDAGRIELLAPVGGVFLPRGPIKTWALAEDGFGFLLAPPPGPDPGEGGALLGKAQGGRGGSFFLDTRSLASFSSLNSALSAGGFNEVIEIRVRGGDLVVGPTDTVTASWLRLSADGGSLAVQGVLEADRVHLFARENVNLLSGSTIRAVGEMPGASGGEVFLGSSSGSINLASGARIDVSGGPGGPGGSVSFRASRQGNDVLVNLHGTISGASGVYVEGVRVYEDTNITTSDINAWRIHTQDFMRNASTIKARLLGSLISEGWDSSALHLLPSIEVRSSGTLTLSNDWDLTTWRFAGEPGMLSLRASEHLNINGNLLDRPTAISSLPGSPGRDSWGITLVAGADLSGADPMAVRLGQGDLKIDSGKMVYTESAPIWFASGRDTVIGPGSPTGYMIRNAIRYSMGTYDAEIMGKVGRDLVIRGGAIQSATGDISIDVGRDLMLQIAQDHGSTASFTSLGSIRTTGQGTTGISNFWDYQGGGDILLNIKGSVRSSLATNAWDFAYGPRPPRRWAASFENHNATEGLATMGGGSLTIYAGGEFYGQAGTFGAGDLTIITGGGDLDGRFLVKAGRAELHSMGNFGTRLANNAIEAFDARIRVSAQGDIALGTIVNPTISRDGFTGFWNLGYTPSSSVSLISVTGDVSVSGDSAFYPLGASVSNLERILPPSLEIRAGRDIRLLNDFALAPSPTGRLFLFAGRDIDGQYLVSSGGRTSVRRASINMSDVAPQLVYGDRGRTVSASLLFSKYEHDPNILHLEDPEPVVVQAGRDIRNISLCLPKKAEIYAGRDIRDIYYFGQNVSVTDVSVLRAGRDILFSSFRGTNYETGMEHAGPGVLMVQAAGRIDLGTTKGILTTGNANNPALGTEGSSIFVVAGYDKTWTPSDIRDFFTALRDAGKDYSELLAKGQKEESDDKLKDIRQNILGPFFEGARVGDGSVEMVRSQISTASGGEIYAIASGSMNVGVSTLTTEAQRENSGINTMAGGSIWIFALGDVNVNESRVMTFLGGDIVIWSDSGDVNAGRGSKTAVNTSRPVRVNVGSADNPIWVLQRRPVAVGSGVRTLTYDPDGLEGPIEPPLAGDVYIFAPEGVIDAGEAGISGRNVFLGATAVLNVQNISFSVGAIGVPLTVESGPSIGALTGTTGLTEATKTMEQTASMSTADRTLSKEETAKLAEALMPKWVKVEFIGYEEEEERKRGS